MTSPFSRLEPFAYAALRIVAGLLFFFHGAQKFGVLGDRQVELMSRLGLAGLIELVAGLFITAGFLTVPSAFIASGEMAFAYFLSHQPRGGWPIQNGGEPAALFCFIFLFISTRGAGRISIDERI